MSSSSNDKSGQPPDTEKKKLQTDIKPTLLRSHSLYSPLAHKFPQGVYPTNHPEPQTSSGKSKTSPTSSMHLQGSAKLQRYPSSRQNEMIRKNSFSGVARFSKKTGSMSSNSSLSSPSSPSATLANPNPLSYYGYNVPSSSSHSSKKTAHHDTTNPSKHHISEQNKARYRSQENAYIKKMNNEYTDEYATKAIDAVKDYFEFNESDSEVETEFESDFPDGDQEVEESTEAEDIYESPGARLERSSTLPGFYDSRKPSDFSIPPSPSNEHPTNILEEDSQTRSLQSQYFSSSYLDTDHSKISADSKYYKSDKNLQKSPLKVASPTTATSVVTFSNAKGKINIFNESEPVADIHLQKKINKPMIEEEDPLKSVSTNELKKLEDDDEGAADKEKIPTNEPQKKPFIVLPEKNSLPKSSDSQKTDSISSDDEFQKIFGNADAEEEQDIGVTYATEISRINGDKLVDTFQIDDSVIYPLVKSKLKPELLEDEKFLERFEWQAMLGVVVKSDIVNDEKRRMIKKQNFGVHEDHTNILSAHGESYLSSFFINQYKENLWLSLQAKKFGHDLEQQKSILAFSRSLMDEVIEEILNFRYDGSSVEKKFYTSLIEESNFGPNVTVDILSKPSYKETLTLTPKQSHNLDALLYDDASNVIDVLLEKYDNCEQLWVTHEEMLSAKPVVRQFTFQRRLETLISWKNIVGSLQSEKSILLKWFKNETQYRQSLSSPSKPSKNEQFSQDFSASHSSSSNSSLSRLGPIEDLDNLSNTQSEVGSDKVFDDDMPPIAEASSLDEVILDINELDASSFAENILAYKNLADVVDKKIFSVINPWSRKSKAVYLSNRQIFEEVNLPSFLPILLELVKFPSNLIKEVIRFRLQYAKSVTKQTLLGVDQTIYDFKVIIQLCFQVKENLFKFLNGIPDIDVDYLEIDFEKSDKLLLDFTDYLLVLYHRKLLDSARSSYSFTTYKEPEILENEWNFLKNIGYYLEINSGFKVSRNFLYLTARLVERLVNYVSHQLESPILDYKLRFIKWYTTTFDNFNNVKRTLTKLTNNALKMVQNSLILHLNFTKDFQIIKSMIRFFTARNHVMITINGNYNLHSILYNKGKESNENNISINDKAPKKNFIIYVFGSQDLINVPEKEIIGSLQGSKLGADLEKPSIDAFINYSNLMGGGGSSYSGPSHDSKPDYQFYENENALDADKSQDSSRESDLKNSRPRSRQTSESTAIFNNEKNDVKKQKRYGNPAYLIVIPVVRKITWEGKTRNITISEQKLGEFPKLVSARYGNALLIAQGSPHNITFAKQHFINNLKQFYVNECDIPSEFVHDIKGDRNTEEFAIRVFDKIDALSNEDIDSDNDSNIPTPAKLSDRKILKVIRTIKTERTCSLLQIQKELVRINKSYNKMAFILIEQGLQLKDKILATMQSWSTEPDPNCLEILNNLFYVIRDTAFSALRNIEPDDLKKFMEFMIRISIDWIKLVVDDCIAKDKKTFRWCVSALEFAVFVFQKFNILLLTDEQFSVLKVKIAGCLSLLISHFDIMGARSNKEDQALLSYSKLQKKVIQKETTLALNKNSALNEKIIEIEKNLDTRNSMLQQAGRVLDEDKSENKFLSYLSSSFSNFSSKWQKGDYLGGGAFGSVYTANDLTNGNVMAVKEVKFPNSESVANIGKIIKDEMTVLEMLQHPNIVKYYGVEVHRDKIYLFMEYCDNGSLASLLKQGRIAEEQLVQWYTLQMVEGLSYLHQNNISHRDIKPENILLDHLGVLRFVDFGAAKVIASSGANRGLKQPSAGVAGTPMYMAPETMIDPEHEYWGSEDIWALGCCVLEMCTGHRPWYQFDNIHAIMYQIARGNKPQLPGPGEVSPEGIDFLERCFTIDPQKRATAEELFNHPWLAEVKVLRVGIDSNASSSDLSEFNG